VYVDLERRDALDSSRKVAPLKCPADARSVDTSHLSLDQVVAEILSFIPQIEPKSQSQSTSKKKGNWFYRFILFLAHCFFKLFYHHKVYGAEHFCEGGAIIASNHVSNLDPPALAISSPEELHFLAKEELFKNFLFGGLIRALNSHPVKGGAGDITVLKLICKLLGEGKKVLLFPEGKRGDKDELDVLKQGVALLISRSQAAVIPAYVYGTLPIWNRKRNFPKLWGRTACVFGTPIRWSEFSHLEKREAQEQVTAKLALAMNRLRQWYHQGAKGTPP